MRRLLTLAPILLLLGAAWLASGATGASSNLSVALDVPSATTLTNNCTAASAQRFGTVQPGTAVTTATGAGSCQISFGSTNDTSALRMATKDGAGAAMSSPSVAWATKRTEGLQFRPFDRSSANTAVVGGFYGLLARTVDGGATWKYLYSAIGSGDYVFGIDHAPGSNDYFVAGGGNAYVVSSSNVTTSAPADPTWTSRRAALVAAGFPGTEHIAGVGVVSSSVWFLAGEQGHVAKTTNGGTSFTVYTVAGLTALTDIEALDANNVYLSGNGGSFAYTTTGGGSGAAWTTVNTGCGCWYNSIAVGDATHVYFSSDSAPIARWNGASASVVYQPTRMFEARSIATSTTAPATVFVATALGKVLKSTDSGATWARLDTPASGSLRGIDAVSATDVMAVGSSEQVIRSTDGSSFTMLMADAGHTPLRAIAPHPTDGTAAIAVGGGGTILRTTNSGSTFPSVPSGTTNNLNDVTWLSTNRAIAVGMGGTILVSTDAGLTWSSRPSGTSQELLAIADDGNDVLYASGTGGTILRSANRGESWSALASGTTEPLEAISAWGTQNVVAVGEDNTVRRSANAGATFTAGTGMPGWEDITGVAFTDATTVYAATLYSGVYKSTDSGATYTALAGFPGSVVPEALMALDQSVYAIDRWGNAAISRDGGATWSNQQSYTGVDFDMVVDGALVDAHTFWTVDNLGGVRRQDENSLAASQVANYGGANTFTNGTANGAFGVCLQSLTTASPGVGWTVDGGTCTASDTDPWKAVPTSPFTVATTTTGLSGTATFVWGLAPKTSQGAGSYRATVAFETLAPAV